MIYLDNAASTPPGQFVLDTFNRFALECYANQESIHQAGYAVRKKLDTAADDILKLLAFGDKAAVLWTTSGTAGINTVLQHPSFNAGNIVTTKAEHAALDESLKALGNCELRYVKLNADGSVDLESLNELIDENTVAVAMHHVQSETGVVQDLVAVREVIDRKSSKAKLIVDTVQAIGKVTIPFKKAKVDFCFIAGHKIGSPFGAAVVYRDVDNSFTKFFKDLRSHRHSLSRPEPAVVLAFVEQLKHVFSEFEKRDEAIVELNELLRKGVAGIKLHSGKIGGTVDSKKASPYIVHFAVPGFQSGVLVRFLASRGVMVSSGSACEAEVKTPSRALTAMGFDKAKAFSALRVSLWSQSSKEDVELFVKEFQSVINDY